MAASIPRSVSSQPFTSAHSNGRVDFPLGALHLSSRNSHSRSGSRPRIPSRLPSGASQTLTTIRPPPATATSPPATQQQHHHHHNQQCLPAKPPHPSAQYKPHLAMTTITKPSLRSFSQRCAGRYFFPRLIRSTILNLPVQRQKAQKAHPDRVRLLRRAPADRSRSRRLYAEAAERNVLFRQYP